MRRTLGLIASLILLQFTLLGSGTLSVVGARGHHMPHGSDSSQCAAKGLADSCGEPVAPGGCASISCCASPIVVAVALTFQATSSYSSLVRMEPAVAESGPASAPEIPPPRA